MTWIMLKVLAIAKFGIEFGTGLLEIEDFANIVDTKFLTLI